MFMCMSRHDMFIMTHTHTHICLSCAICLHAPMKRVKTLYLRLCTHMHTHIHDTEGYIDLRCTIYVYDVRYMYIKRHDMFTCLCTCKTGLYATHTRTHTHTHVYMRMHICNGPTTPHTCVCECKICV